MKNSDQENKAMSQKKSAEIHFKKILMANIYLSAFFVMILFLLFIANPSYGTDKKFHCENSVNQFFHFSIYWVKTISLFINTGSSILFLTTNRRAVFIEGLHGFTKLHPAQLVVLFAFSLLFMFGYPFVVIDTAGDCEAIKNNVFNFVFFGIFTNTTFYIMGATLFATPAEIARRFRLLIQQALYKK